MKRYLLVLGLIVVCLGIFYGPNVIRLNNVINLYIHILTVTTKGNNVR